MYHAFDARYVNVVINDEQSGKTLAFVAKLGTVVSI